MLVDRCQIAGLPRWAHGHRLALGILIAGAAASMALLTGRSDPDGGGAPLPSPPRIPVVLAQQTDVYGSIRSQGTVEPSVEIDLVAEVGGRVRAVSSRLDPGARFLEGDVLVEIDPREAELAVSRAEAALAGARAELALATDDRDRLSALAQHQSTSAATLAKAIHRHAAALAASKEARAVLGQAQYDLERTTIRAPFSGRVRTKTVGVGQVVATGAVVGRIYATDYAEVRLPVRTSELLLAGLPLSGRRNDDSQLPPAVAVLRTDLGGTPFEWEGVVDRIEGTIASDSRMVNLVVRIDDPFEEESQEPPSARPVRRVLLPGLFVEAEVRGGVLRNVVILPESALHRASGIFVVGPDDTLQRREVQVLQRRRDWVVVRGNLKPGSRIARSAATLLEGMAIQPVASESHPPPAATFD